MTGRGLDLPERGCGCLGCKNEGAVVVDHPHHGVRTVCESCADGYEVIRNV